MKACMLFLLLTSVAFQAFAQGEFVVEKYDGTQVFYKSKGCSPNDGVIVYYAKNPNLKFTMPDTPKRLRNASGYDTERSCYVLCVQPTSNEIGGITKYSIDIITDGHVPYIHEIRDVRAAETQYYTVKSEDDAHQAALRKLQSELIYKAATDAFNSGEYAEAVRLYKESAANSPDAGETIRKDVAAKFKEKAADLLQIIGEDQMVKTLLDYADDIYPPKVIDSDDAVGMTLKVADDAFEP